MHLLIPFASAPGAAPTQATQALRLPRLQRLLSRLSPGMATRLDATSLNLPHEHVLAANRGWSADDGRLPLAAVQAQADGLAAASGDAGWGLLTPSHWQVGSDGIVLLDPAALRLGEDESRALFQSLLELFESIGWALHWGAPLRWYVTHASLAELATASPDRVVGRGIDQWLPDRRNGRTVRRLQSEAQMLLHTHPVNAAREARGELAVNSFWLSGTGRTQPVAPGAIEPVVDARLREPWLAGDVQAWAQAWAALDAQRLGELDDLAQRGAAVGLTLCGECVAQRYESASQGPAQRLVRDLVRRWRSPAIDTVLQAL